jgi:hypothetical protein
MIQSAALALLLDKIKTFGQCFKTFLKLEQAWARLKILASLLCSIEQSSDNFFCSDQILYGSGLIFSVQAKNG